MTLSGSLPRARVAGTRRSVRSGTQAWLAAAILHGELLTDQRFNTA
jgi:hypothetical protein